MKVKTLIVLSIVFFAIGTLGGAAYAFVSSGSINILPTLKTSEEKMIDKFIAEQEKKQDDTQTASNQSTEDDNTLPGDTTEPTEPDEQQPDNATTGSTSKRMGQPTVSDGTTLRVRATPDAQKGEVLMGIPNTETVEIIAEQNGWYQIITSNGTKGWVSAEYMKEIQ